MHSSVATSFAITDTALESVISITAQAESQLEDSGGVEFTEISLFESLPWSSHPN